MRIVFSVIAWVSVLAAVGLVVGVGIAFGVALYWDATYLDNSHVPDGWTRDDGWAFLMSIVWRTPVIFALFGPPIAIKRHLNAKSRATAASRASDMSFVEAFERDADKLTGLTKSTLLAQVQGHFQSHAIIPFWDAVDRSESAVQGFDQLEGSLRLRESKYKKLCTELGRPERSTSLDQAVIARDKLSSGTESLVYRAHQDAEFANIYQQRASTRAVQRKISQAAEANVAVGAAIGGVLDEIADSLDEISEASEGFRD